MISTCLSGNWSGPVDKLAMPSRQQFATTIATPDCCTNPAVQQGLIPESSPTDFLCHRLSIPKYCLWPSIPGRRLVEWSRVSLLRPADGVLGVRAFPRVCLPSRRGRALSGATAASSPTGGPVWHHIHFLTRQCRCSCVNLNYYGTDSYRRV